MLCRSGFNSLATCWSKADWEWTLLYDNLRKILNFFLSRLIVGSSEIQLIIVNADHNISTIYADLVDAVCRPIPHRAGERHAVAAKTQCIVVPGAS